MLFKGVAGADGYFFEEARDLQRISAVVTKLERRDLNGQIVHFLSTDYNVYALKGWEYLAKQ